MKGDRRISFGIFRANSWVDGTLQRLSSAESPCSLLVRHNAKSKRCIRRLVRNLKRAARAEYCG